MSKLKRCQNEYCNKQVPKSKILNLNFNGKTLRLCLTCGFDLMKSADLGHKAIIKYKGNELEFTLDPGCLHPTSYSLSIFDKHPDIAKLKKLMDKVAVQ